jgi:hypothetical protein
VADEDDTRRRSSGISTTTLVSASVASAVATFVVSRIWGPGTLIGAAVTPVIVALVSEAVRRPAEQVRTTARRVVPVAAARPRPRARAGEAPQEAERQGIDLEDIGLQAPPPPGPEDIVVFEGPRRDYAVAPHPVVRHWRKALVTGVLAFLVVLVIYTVPDVIAGRSITGRGTSSTFFGGSRHHAATTPTTTTTAPKTTPTATTPPVKTTTAPPVTVTQTVPAPQTTPPPATTPAPTTPAQTTPAPSGGTPAPTP